MSIPVVENQNNINPTKVYNRKNSSQQNSRKPSTYNFPQIPEQTKHEDDQELQQNNILLPNQGSCYHIKLSNQQTTLSNFQPSQKNGPQLQQVTSIINRKKYNQEQQKKKKRQDPAEKARKRRDIIQQLQIKRARQVSNQSPVKYNKNQMLKRVSKIIFNHIHQGQKLRKIASQAALMFRQTDFSATKWTINQANGFQSTIPMFIYHLEKLRDDPQPPLDVSEVHEYIYQVFSKMKLTFECSIIFLIYIERLMSCAEMQLRALNWRPVVFIAILLASKFWEDINFWNIDYADRFPNRFSLRSINELENRFFALCDYNLFISYPYYLKYYFAINAINNPVNDFIVQAEFEKKIRASNIADSSNFSALQRQNIWSEIIGNDGEKMSVVSLQNQSGQKIDKKTNILGPQPLFEKKNINKKNKKTMDLQNRKKKTSVNQIQFEREMKIVRDIWQRK